MTHTLLALYAQTPIHAGTGQNTVSSIDLPIQREGHTGFPCIYGSATKGAIRAKFEGENNANVKRLFGDAGESGNAGCLAITDTRLLLLPVRSLTSHFKWVTCPALLQRYKQDAERMNKTAPDVPKVEKDKALVHNATKSDYLYLEEYRLNVQIADLNDWIQTLAELMPNDMKQALEDQLTLVDDDIFAFLAQNATPVHAHNAIDNATKTVKSGALWWEESLPADTLLYTCIHAFQGRQKDQPVDAQTNLADFKQAFDANPYLQIGGNETVGMGFCLTKLV
ncbi:MAG: type III-B CRISPR module RAMP protein Cmr4 [Thiomicrospira sp.]|jgi:CRISPR-associated protein Cmr4|nr:type III-B CRISPR module RAMP protein Cmr4 [Thiomicrospira sp.]